MTIWNCFRWKISFRIKRYRRLFLIWFQIDHFLVFMILKNWKNQLQRPLLKDGNTNKHVLTKLTLLPFSKYFNFENLKILLDLSISRNHMIPTCTIFILRFVKMFELQWITYVKRRIHLKWIISIIIREFYQTIENDHG